MWCWWWMYAHTAPNLHLYKGLSILLQVWERGKFIFYAKLKSCLTAPHLLAVSLLCCCCCTALVGLWCRLSSLQGSQRNCFVSYHQIDPPHANIPSRQKSWGFRGETWTLHSQWWLREKCRRRTELADSACKCHQRTQGEIWKRLAAPDLHNWTVSREG